MRRFAHHLNTILNVLFAVLAVALLVLGVLSLVGGPSLRFVPYMAGICALYYLVTAVKVFMQGERRSAFRGIMFLLLTLLCAVFCYVTYRSLL